MLFLLVLLECVAWFNFLTSGENNIKLQSNVMKKNVDFGQNITLSCSGHIVGNQIEWKKTGKAKDEVLPHGDLRLHNVQKNDSGIYECSIAHEDILLTRIELVVRTRPAALANVTVIPKSVFALIQWNLEDDGGYPVNITVRYKERKKNDWHYINPQSISHIQRQAEVYKLKSNTSYIFQIWATNVLGAGEITTVSERTIHDNREIELARHLLQGADTFDTRVWLVAVAVVMITLIILTIGVCYMTYRDVYFGLCSSRNNEAQYKVDPERIELISNVILNPGYIEEITHSSHKIIYKEERKVAVEHDDDVMTTYFAFLSGAKAVDV